MSQEEIIEELRAENAQLREQNEQVDRIWPTSKPRPRSTPPDPGTRPINAFRPEQVVKIDYLIGFFNGLAQ
jgi:hypothetical protein